MIDINNRTLHCNIYWNEEIMKKEAFFGKNWGTLKRGNSKALRTGNGLVVIDVDTLSLSELEKPLQDILAPYKPTTKSKRGYHYYFTSDELFSNDTHIVEHVDIRGQGGVIFYEYNGDNEHISYKFNKKHIYPMPTSLLQWLIDHDGLKVEHKSTPKTGEAKVLLGEAREKLFARDINNYDRMGRMKLLAAFYDGVGAQKGAYKVAREWADTHKEGYDSFENAWHQLERGAFGEKITYGSLVYEGSKDVKPAESTTNSYMDLISMFSMSEEELSKDAKDYESLAYNILFRGQICSWVARPNGGKTLLAKHIAAKMAKEGNKVTYIFEDGDFKGSKDMTLYGREYGFQVISTLMRVGATSQELLETIIEQLKSDRDMSKDVYIFDTLKKFTNTIDKASNVALYKNLRKLTARGATVLLLSHTNKLLDEHGDIVYEGTIDTLADVDAMYYLVDDGDTENKGERFVTFERKKGRSLTDVSELSFSMDISTYTANVLDEVVDTKEIAKRNHFKKEFRREIEEVSMFMNEQEGGHNQMDCASRLQESGMGVNAAKKLLWHLDGDCWFGTRYKDKRNAVYYTVKDPKNLFKKKK